MLIFILFQLRMFSCVSSRQLLNRFSLSRRQLFPFILYFSFFTFNSVILSILPPVSQSISESNFNEINSSRTTTTNNHHHHQEPTRPRSKSKFYTNQLFEETPGEEIGTSQSLPRNHKMSTNNEPGKKVTL